MGRLWQCRSALVCSVGCTAISRRLPWSYYEFLHAHSGWTWRMTYSRTRLLPRVRRVDHWERSRPGAPAQRRRRPLPPGRQRWRLALARRRRSATPTAPLITIRPTAPAPLPWVPITVRASSLHLLTSRADFFPSVTSWSCQKVGCLARRRHTCPEYSPLGDITMHRCSSRSRWRRLLAWARAEDAAAWLSSAAAGPG